MNNQNIDKKAVAYRLKQFLTSKFSSIDEAGEALGTTGNTLRTTYLNGNSLPGSLLLYKLLLIGCDIKWLLSGEVSDADNSNTIPIPILDIYAATGINGYCNNDYTENEGELLVPKHMLKQNKKYSCIKVKGKSMEPTLAEGSYIVISEIQDINSLQDGNIYIIITKEGIAYLKRIQLETENKIKCISDNFDKFAFPDFYINTEDIYKIYEINIYITNVLNNSAYEVLKRVVLLENDMLTIKNKLNKQ